MELFIRKTELSQAESLLKIQHDAFLEDEKIYGGSPSSETLEQLISKIEESYHYTIFNENKIIGGIRISKVSEDTYRIRRVYIDKNYQNRGLGSQLIKLIENEFPEAKKWTLDTPYLNFRNQHFYEKAGYKKVGETKYSDKLTLIDYEKHII